MKLQLNDSRLLAAAGMVRPGSVVADIGTDHGLLVCYLVGNGISPMGYACDIAEGPLENARQTIARLGLEDRVRLVLTNGLQGLALREIDDVVIAGMGGELIADILEGCPEAKDRHLRFVLQPMTKAERLRRSLYRMGFSLLEECGVGESGFLYTVMAAEYSGAVREVDEFFAWTGLLPWSNDPGSRQMLLKIRSQLEEIADGLVKSKRLAASSGHYRSLLAQIDKIITGES